MAPFTIGSIFVYSVTIIQASVMKPVGVIGPSVISCLYPCFRRYFWIPHWKHPVSGLIAKHRYRLTTTHRSAIGNIPASFFYGWLWLVDRRITYAYENDGSQISILYQIPCYAAIIAAGEVFAMTASFEKKEGDYFWTELTFDY